MGKLSLLMLSNQEKKMLKNKLVIYFRIIIAATLVMFLNLSFAMETNRPHRCEVSAFVIDKDPKGLNVRSAPNEDIISKIPRKTYQLEEAIIVHIIDAKEDWLKIDQWSDSVTTATFNRDAWVYGKLVATTIKSDSEESASGSLTRIYAKPFPNAEVIGQMSAQGQTVNILDCNNQWVLIIGKTLDGTEVQGWLSPQGQCPNLIANCT